MAASEDFARRADAVLTAGGELWRSWRLTGHARPGIQPAAPAGGLIVEDDHAELRYDRTMFRASQRRLLRNDGLEPVSLLVRELARGNPLAVAWLDLADEVLKARCPQCAGPMTP
jgi:hypothetical protein